MLDIYNSAHKAAAANIAIIDPFQLQQAGMNAFVSDNNATKDWPLWQRMFNERAKMLAQLSKRPAPSAAPVNPVKPATPPKT